MAQAPPPLYVGTGTFVAALDPRTGEELWRTRLSRAGVGGPVTLVLKGRYIYAGCHGRVYCLDRRDGNLVWTNGLPRMGYHAVLLAMEGADAVSSRDVAVTEVRQQQARAAAAAGGAAGASACM